MAAFLVDHQLLNSNKNITSPIHLDREKATPSKLSTNLINSDRKEATNTSPINSDKKETNPAITKANNTSPIQPNMTEVIQEEISYRPNRVANHSGRTRDATKLTKRYDRD